MAAHNDPAGPYDPADRRILCLTGPESTGKSTLAARLAETLGGVLVTEVARRYLAGREDYDAADLRAIARAQIESEEAALLSDAPLIVCDTDLTVIQVWWEEKFGALPQELNVALGDRYERGYLLLKPDLPWIEDPLRENPHDRERLYARYEQLLAAGPFPYAVVEGEGEARWSSLLAGVRAIYPDLLAG